MIIGVGIDVCDVDRFAESIERNVVHGSDAAETAATEVAFFFPGMDLHSR